MGTVIRVLFVYIFVWASRANVVGAGETTPWKLRLGNKVVLTAPRTQILRTAFVTHSAHHRAQLGV